MELQLVFLACTVALLLLLSRARGRGVAATSPPTAEATSHSTRLRTCLLSDDPVSRRSLLAPAMRRMSSVASSLMTSMTSSMVTMPRSL